MTDPARYARSIGVRIQGRAYFYGMTPGMFGSEPWLISLGDNVHIVGGTNFVTHDGGVLILRDKYPDLEITQPIKVGNNVYIAMNCLIMPGITIGDEVIIGAGSIVTRDIPNNSVAVGVPARVIKTTQQYLEGAKRKSLGFGNLSADNKADALKKHFGIIPK